MGFNWAAGLGFLDNVAGNIADRIDQREAEKRENLIFNRNKKAQEDAEERALKERRVDAAQQHTWDQDATLENQNWQDLRTGTQNTWQANEADRQHGLSRSDRIDEAGDAVNIYRRAGESDDDLRLRIREEGERRYLDTQKHIGVNESQGWAGLKQRDQDRVNNFWLDSIKLGQSFPSMDVGARGTASPDTYFSPFGDGIRLREGYRNSNSPSVGFSPRTDINPQVPSFAAPPPDSATLGMARAGIQQGQYNTVRRINEGLDLSEEETADILGMLTQRLENSFERAINKYTINGKTGDDLVTAITADLYPSANAFIGRKFNGPDPLANRAKVIGLVRKYVEMTVASENK